jgi:hypothetical protein
MEVTEPTPNLAPVSKTRKYIIMNVKVEIELDSTPEKQDYIEVYDAAIFLTNDPDSVSIYKSKRPKNSLVAEFTINKARQIDVVDGIGKQFSYNLEGYLESSISFPKKALSKKKI